jgi:hypothetical protein
MTRIYYGRVQKKAAPSRRLPDGATVNGKV